MSYVMMLLRVHLGTSNMKVFRCSLRTLVMLTQAQALPVSNGDRVSAEMKFPATNHPFGFQGIQDCP
jgi:hypothetical protein